MGCGASSSAGGEESARAKKIDEMLSAEQANMEEEIKMLLLGAGESGKSTIVKQMKILYHSGFNKDEKEAFRPLIYDNVLEAMRNVINACESFGLDIENREDAEEVMDVSSPSDFSESVGNAIARLWQDGSIQAAFKRASEFQLIDSASYYFGEVARMAKPDYLPTSQDILRARVRTTGIVETEFAVDGIKFRLVDVGGQRNERKKWIHCFEDVTAVFFVVAMSEYDQKLFEDESVSRMDESLRLFDEVCNLRWFAQTPIVLFMNKMDIFEQKLRRVPLSMCFEGYTGADESDEARAYLAGEFVKIAKEQEVYYHFTTATDTSNVRFVFLAARDIVLKAVKEKKK